MADSFTSEYLKRRKERTAQSALSSMATRDYAQSQLASAARSVSTSQTAKIPAQPSSSPSTSRHSAKSAFTPSAQKADDIGRQPGVARAAGSPTMTSRSRGLVSGTTQPPPQPTASSNPRAQALPFTPGAYAHSDEAPKNGFQRLNLGVSGILQGITATPGVLYETGKQQAENTRMYREDPEVQDLQKQLSQLSGQLDYIARYKYPTRREAEASAEYQDILGQMRDITDRMSVRRVNAPVDMESEAMQRYFQAKSTQEKALDGLTGAPRWLGEQAISIGQNAAVLPLSLVSPALSLGAMGSISAADRMYELSAQGKSADEALTRGLVSGAIEAATEKIPLDNLMDLVRTGGKSALKNLLKQAGVEAGEESLSYVMNYIADKAARDPDAEFSLSELANSAAGGAFSGLVFGGLGTAINRMGSTQAAQEGTASPRTAPDVEVNGPQRGTEVGESGFNVPSAVRDTDLKRAFGENGAQAYRLGWRGDMDEADYYRAFAHAYNAGAAGRSLDSLKDRTLTDAQRGAAFESGRSDADAAARKAGFTTVYGKDSGLVCDDYTKSMDQKVAGQVNEVAKRLGVKVQFADRVAGGAANAKIENGVITIARDAKNPVRAVFGHEITHRIQELAPEEYRAFREAAMAHYENAEDGMVDALVWDQQSRYTKVDQDLSNLDAMDEIAADYAGSLMEDGALLDRFIQANQGKRTLLWKLRDVFRSLADRLTGKYKDQARQAERRLEQALKAAESRAEAMLGQKNTAQEGGVKYSAMYRNKADSVSDFYEFALNNRNNPAERNKSFYQYELDDGYKVDLFFEGATHISDRHSLTGSQVEDIFSGLNDVRYYTLAPDVQSTYDGVPVKAVVSTPQGNSGVLLEFLKNGRVLVRTAFFGSDAELSEWIKKSDPSALANETSPKAAVFAGNHFSMSSIRDAIRNSQDKDRKNNTKFSLKSPVEETSDLLALHNKDENSILEALKLGGLPMPSIAVVKARDGHTKYGPISLVFSKDTIDPQLFRTNRVYGGDAWTPTAPRVDYPVNSKKASQVEHELHRLAGDVSVAGGIFGNSAALRSVGIDDTSTRSTAELAEKLASTDTVRAAYLADQGKSLEPVKMDKVWDKFGNDTLQKVVDRLGVNTLAEIEANLETGESVKDALGENAEVIRDILRDYYREQGEPMLRRMAVKRHWTDAEINERRQTRIDNSMDGVSIFTLEDIVHHAWDMYQDGGATKGEIDRMATSDALRSAVDDHAVEEWIAGKLDGLLGEAGIYNGKDPYTPSGNLRSFSQLHYAYTLENIVKAMKEGQEERGGNTWGASAKTLQSVATPEYRSIQEIKADSGRLGMDEGAEYEAKLQAIDDQIGSIITKVKQGNSAHSDNSFIESDIIGSILMETSKGKRTVDAIMRAFSKEGYKISSQTAQDIQAVYQAAAEMPTGYFEAKPQRAVGFDEVLAAVIPDDSSEKLRDGLEQAGVRMLEYKTGDDTDRLAKVNSVEGARFSLKGSDQLTREIDRLMKQVQDGTRSEAEVRQEIRGLVDEVYQGMVEQYGSIKPGEKPAREVRVPRRTADDRKVSQTVRTILEAEATPDAAVQNIEELTATGVFSYETYTDKAAIADAENTIRDKGYATALAEWSESVGKGEVSKANAATGWALYNAAANAGDLKSAMTVLTKMVGHQRNAAQAVQATRILKSMSPEGQLYGVQRSVGNLQEELKKKYGKNAPDLKIDPNLAENLLKAENQEARDEAAKELFRDIGRQMPSRFMDKWNAWRYLAMLGNPRTHVRNIVGNAFFAPVVAAKSLTATSIEAAVSRVSHGKLERTKGAVGLGKADRALLSSAWADYANVQDSALGGGKYSDFANANQYIEEGRRIFKNKALETFRKGNTKALDAEDVWFSRPHYAYALAQYCKANHITAEQIAAGKGMDKARAYAIKEAQKATYRDTNALSQAISDLGRYRGKGPVGKGISTVMEGVLPFRKTPANILARGLEYSPAGLLKGLTYDLYQVREGNLSGAEAIDHISAGMTGTGLLAFGAYCAAQCLVRGAGGDDKDRKKFAELQGHQNYALELPDGTSITLDWLAPEVLPFFIGVNLWEMTQGEKEPLTLSAILRASANVTEPLLEMSCLQSLNDVFDAVGYASSGDLNGLTAALVTAATSYLTQGVPTVLGQFERTGQEERMTTYTEKNAFLTPDAQYTTGRISGRIPGWDYNQIPYIDAWGRTERTGGAAKRAVDNFVNPAYTSKAGSSPMEDELTRLYDATGEKNVFPARAGKYFTVNGVRKDLTAEEYVTYATKKGQLSHTLVTELTGSKSYQSMTDEQKVKAISDAYDLANKLAKKAVAPEYKVDSWVEKAAEAEKKHRIPQHTYVSLYSRTSGMESLRYKDKDVDKDGKPDAIPGSRSLRIMMEVFNTPGLSDKQRQAMFQYLGVSKDFWHWNRTLVQERLKRMEKEAG